MILDTNALTAMAEGETSLFVLLKTVDSLHLSVVVLGEYRFGLLRSRIGKQIGAWLDRLELRSLILNIDRQTAREYAAVRDQLRKQGTPIPENDLWIAAMARQHDQPIVSRDRHFDHVPHVRRMSW